MTVHKVLPLCLMTLSMVACEEKSAPTPGTEAASNANQAADKAGDAKEDVAKAGDSAAGAVQAAAAAVPAAVKEAVMPGPDQICGDIIAAAKAKDDGKFLSLSTPATGTAFSSVTAKEHVYTTLSTVTCGAAKAEGDSAIIPLVGSKPPQEATFSKGADGWKFDGASFIAKYPVKVIKDKAKKAAAKMSHKGKKHAP